MSEQIIAPPYVSEVPKKKKMDEQVKMALVKLVKILGRPQEQLFNLTTKYNYQHMSEEQEDWTFHVEYKYMKKLFSLEEVYEMHNILSAHMKPNENIFTFEGTSPWIQVKYMKSPEGKIKILSQTRIKSKRNEQQMFRFINEDKRLVVSPVMIPNKRMGRIDPLTKEQYICEFSAETIQKSSEKYMKELKLNNSNIMHDNNDKTKITMIESWLVCDDPKMDKSSYYGFNLTAGTWMAIIRVNDDDTWKDIKSGKLKGLSIEGNYGQIIKN